jgi:hypothetical protein
MSKDKPDLLEVVGWVANADVVTPSERSMLFALASHWPHIFPSVPRLAAIACVEPRRAQQILRLLEAKGLIKTTRGDGRTHSSQYELLINPVAKKTAKESLEFPTDFKPPAEDIAYAKAKGIGDVTVEVAKCVAWYREKKRRVDSKAFRSWCDEYRAPTPKSPAKKIQHRKPSAFEQPPEPEPQSAESQLEYWRERIMEALATKRKRSVDNLITVIFHLGSHDLLDEKQHKRLVELEACINALVSNGELLETFTGDVRYISIA